MQVARTMRILGYVLLAIAGLGPLVDPNVHLTPAVEGWIAAYVVFALAFHLGATAGEGQHVRRRSALAVQTSALLAMAALLPCQFGALTLVVAASQAALVLRPRGALAWMALQTAGVAFFLVPTCHLQEGLADVTALAGFQGFAAVAIYLARREAEARSQLSQANAELVATRSLLDEASRAHERTRIARELHDVLGHDLTALGLQLEIATHVDADAGRAHLTRAQEVNARLLRNVREVVTAMSCEKGPDLAAALRAMVADVPGLAVHLEAGDTLPVEEAVRAQCVLRCVQEIVTNTLRHARARNLWIRVQRDGEHITVDARDDGRGAETLCAGHGLSGMRGRLEEMGGLLEIATAPERAFSVMARLPLRGGTAS
ncbi:MAG TPA: sensor histidine kinase [Polyangiaceae bacterium]|jgi:signal transduction histidine kinase